MIHPALARNTTSDRRTAILVGILFLSSTATFMIGDSLITSYFSGSSPTNSLVLGILAEVYTGLAVAGIGLAMLPLLRPYHSGFAWAYLALRVLECLAIMGVGAFMLTTRQQLPHYDLFIYFFTGIGGVIFSYLLYRSKLIPRPLAGLGLVGYVVLLLAIPTALLGLVNVNAGLGMLFFAPGGLFELILPLLLLVRGFQVTRG